MIQYSTQPRKQRAQSPLYFQSSRPRGLLREYKRSDQSDRTGRLSDSKVAFLIQRDSVTRHLEIHILLISKKRKSSRLLALHNVIFERQKTKPPIPDLDAMEQRQDQCKYKWDISCLVLPKCTYPATGGEFAYTQRTPVMPFHK